MFPEKDEKGTTANQTLVISWTFRRRRRLFRPLAVVMISASRGDFPCLFIMHAATARDRESRRFNRDGGTSRKAIIHGLRSLHFCAGALNGFDIPWWITTTKWGGERRWGGGKKAREQETEEKNPGGVLCLNSLGALSVLVEYCTFLWQACLLSSAHASLSNRVPAEEFLHPARVCVLSCCTPPLN